jgi:hypothetical protein
LASNTKKREGKTTKSLGFFLYLIIIIIIVAIAFSIAEPSPQVFHHWRGKRRIDDGLSGLKSHRSAHLVLTLLYGGKRLTHLLMRLTDESDVGVAHGVESFRPLTRMFYFLPQ